MEEGEEVGEEEVGHGGCGEEAGPGEGGGEGGEVLVLRVDGQVGLEVEGEAWE